MTEKPRNQESTQPTLQLAMQRIAELERDLNQLVTQNALLTSQIIARNRLIERLRTQAQDLRVLVEADDMPQPPFALRDAFASFVIPASAD